MPICWSVVTTEVTAFARSAGVAGSAARVPFRYEPPPNMANRTLAATESWATGSPGCGFGVPAQTAGWTGAQAEHTFALAPPSPPFIIPNDPVQITATLPLDWTNLVVESFNALFSAS
jgi:hypothetical protein